MVLKNLEIPYVLRDFSKKTPTLRSCGLDLGEKLQYTFFHRQIDFSSEPGVANEILENEAKSSLAVA